MKPTEVRCLIRFAPKEYAMEFLKSGRLYMNTWHYFQKLEAKDTLRSDPSEGLAASYDSNSIKIEFEHDSRWLPIGPLAGPVKFSHKDAAYRKVFCTYAFTNLHTTPEIDSRVLDFGDTAIVIMDGDEFLRRVRSTLDSRGLKYAHTLVEYIDPQNYAGTMGPFRKYNTHSYQSEFRIVVHDNRDGPLCDFYVGSLEDIAFESQSATVSSKFRIVEDTEPTLG